MLTLHSNHCICNAIDIAVVILETTQRKFAKGSITLSVLVLKSLCMCIPHNTCAYPCA